MEAEDRLDEGPYPKKRVVINVLKHVWGGMHVFTCFQKTKGIPIVIRYRKGVYRLDAVVRRGPGMGFKRNSIAMIQ
jgi:hypothetical protein